MRTNKTKIYDPQFDYIVAQAVRKFIIQNPVNPIHLNDLFDYPLDIRKSSPGIPWQPYFKTRGEVMDDTSARNSIRLSWHKVKDNRG